MLPEPAPGRRRGAVTVGDPASQPSGPRRVLVHVGAPKTGTSFVQDVLWLNRESLAMQGILYPADRFDEHFLAALDLMELPWGGLERQAVGAWDRLAARVRDWQGTPVVSPEVLATAPQQQGRRGPRSVWGARGGVAPSPPRPVPGSPGQG